MHVTLHLFILILWYLFKNIFIYITLYTGHRSIYNGEMTTKLIPAKLICIARSICPDLFEILANKVYCCFAVFVHHE